MSSHSRFPFRALRSTKTQNTCTSCTSIAQYSLRQKLLTILHRYDSQCLFRGTDMKSGEKVSRASIVIKALHLVLLVCLLVQSHPLNYCLLGTGLVWKRCTHFQMSALSEETCVQNMHVNKVEHIAISFMQSKVSREHLIISHCKLIQGATDHLYRAFTTGITFNNETDAECSGNLDTQPDRIIVSPCTRPRGRTS